MAAKRGRKPKVQRTTKPGPVPDPPDWLAGIALEQWNRLAPKLNSLGLFETLDRDLLALYCDAYAGYVEARQHSPVQIIERTTKSGEPLGNYEQVSGWATIQKTTSKAMVDLMQMMGLTPASRSGLTGSTSCEPAANDDAPNPLAALVARMQGAAAEN